MSELNRSAVAARSRAMKWMLASLVLATSATVAVTAWARPEHGAHGGAAMGLFGGGPGPMFGGRGIDRMLDGLNATDEQRSKIRQIFSAAADDLRAQRESRRALHERSLEILTAPKVDAAAAEAVRQQMLAQHDQASKRMLQAMIDASQVLSAEQRAKLAERIKMRREIMQERRERFEREHPRR